MDMKQLRTFVEVADRGSLTRAADSIHVAQPALGRQIRLLEEELGVRLFDRHGRGMLLTDAGRRLQDRARAILRLVEDTRSEISAASSAVTGSVTLGLPPTVGELLAGRLVERFLDLHPGVAVRIVPAFSGYLRDFLRRGQVDLAVMYDPEGGGEIRTEPLITESLSLVGPPASLPLDDGAEIGFAVVAERRLVLPGRGQGLRELLEDEALKAGLQLDVAVEADALQTMKDLALRGVGFAILPAAAIQAEAEAGALDARMITAPRLRRRLVLARSLLRADTAAVRAFADVLKAEMAEMTQSGIWQAEG